MPKISRAAFWLAFLAVVFSRAASFAEEFASMITNTTRDGALEARIYVSNDKVCVQSVEHMWIIRADRKVMWYVTTKARRYKEWPYNHLYFTATSNRIPGEKSRSFVGKARLNNKMVDKYHVTYEVDGKSGSVFQWFESGLNIPVKTATHDNSWVMEYKSIKVAPQPYEYFEIPNGFEEEEEEE